MIQTAGPAWYREPPRRLGPNTDTLVTRSFEGVTASASRLPVRAPAEVVKPLVVVGCARFGGSS